MFPQACFRRIRTRGRSRHSSSLSSGFSRCFRRCPRTGRLTTAPPQGRRPPPKLRRFPLRPPRRKLTAAEEASARRAPCGRLQGRRRRRPCMWRWTRRAARVYRRPRNLRTSRLHDVWSTCAVGLATTTWVPCLLRRSGSASHPACRRQSPRRTWLSCTSAPDASPRTSLLAFDVYPPVEAGTTMQMHPHGKHCVRPCPQRSVSGWRAAWVVRGCSCSGLVGAYTCRGCPRSCAQRHIPRTSECTTAPRRRVLCWMR
mmetsp:Transcript_62215/g.160557  ORF Transcript_62215/g.160557 Transcript_62215/m.160557 type:complete len:257 (+) Transcript_62215:282-1052(+)